LREERVPSESDGFTVVRSRRDRKPPKRLSLSGKKKIGKKSRKGDPCSEVEGCVCVTREPLETRNLSLPTKN
jgi:hypothetical protein